MRRLSLPLNIFLRKFLQVSGSPGRGRLALGGGFRSVDGPGFDGEVGKGWLSDDTSPPRFGREGIRYCDDPTELAGDDGDSELAQ
jgi:hypothetical protein